MPLHRLAAVAGLCVGMSVSLEAQPRMPIYTPGALNANQQIAHDIYKELIEIPTGVSTGNITTAAVAMAKAVTPARAYRRRRSAQG